MPFVCLLMMILQTAFAQDFTQGIDFPFLLKTMNEQGACLDPGANRLCRHLPWVPRLHEGVISHNNAAYIFLDSELPEGSSISNWSKKFSAETREEMVSYFLVNNPTMNDVLSKSPYTAVYLILLKKVGEPYRIVSIALTPSAQVAQEVATQYNVVQGEINEFKGTDWIPPLTFKMGHQFKLNESL